MENKLFPDQKENEVIIVTFRQHWFSLMPNIISSGFIIILSAAGLFVPFFVKIPDSLLNIFLLLESLLFLAAVVVFYVAWVIYYLTVGILTNERIVDIDQNSLISRKLSFARLESIEDISVNVSGLTNTIFKIGTIKIETAGEISNIEFPHIQNPYLILDEIRKTQEKSPYIYKRTHNIDAQ